MHTHNIRPVGVMIFLLWGNRFFLILRDNKPEIANPDTWCPVTGGVEEGENFLEAVHRELEEEIGLIPEHLRVLGVSLKGNCFFFGRLSDEEVSKIVLGEGQCYCYFEHHELEDLDIKGAFQIYLERFPEIFKRIAEDEFFEPQGTDFGLAIWTTPE